MPVATLIVNPAAGRARLLAAQVPLIEALLGQHGYSTSVLTTTPEADSAAVLAARASCDSALVLACGGDGTIHGVIQGLANTATALGVLALGTHNALAASLGLPNDPLAALRLLVTYIPRLIPLGQIETERATRYFVTMAGCGPSGALAHALAGVSGGKARFGRGVYPLQAARLFATRRWPAFRVEYRLADGTWLTSETSALLISRVPSLGGMFSRLTPGASLASPRLHAWLLRWPLQLSLPAWFATSLAGLANPWLQQIEADELRCTPLGSRTRALGVLTQADAEPLGPLPCTMRIVPDALNLLMPSAAREMG